MDFSSSSIAVILNGKLCGQEFQSLADLTGRLEEKTDDAGMRLARAVWQGLILGGQ